MQIEIKKLEKSEVEVNVTVETASFMVYWPKALKKVAEFVEIDGFRKGHVPENMILAKFGDMIVLEEMANLALRDIYAEAIKNHKLSPVGEPKVTIKKIAKDNPLELAIVVPVLPEMMLPDYKALAKEAKKDEDTTPTAEEIENVLKELQKGRSAQGKSGEVASEVSEVHDHAGHDHHDGHDHAGHDHAEHAHEAAKKEGAKEAALVPLDDTFAQSFGDTFKTLEDLKEKVKENLGLEKKQKLEEKQRQAIIERLIKEVDGTEIPEVLIADEIQRMLTQMKADVTRFGGTWEEYLSYAKKTEDEMRVEWKDDARKRVLSQFVLAKIAEAEKLIATEEEIEVELVRLLAQVQDADPERAKDYLRQALSNDKVFRFLTA
jgi:trigger factor